MATQGIYSSPTNKEDWLVIQDSDGLVNLSVGDWVNNYLSQAKQNGGGVIFDQITIKYHKHLEKSIKHFRFFALLIN